MSDLTHTDESGRARMVDVSGKDETTRVARAIGEIRMSLSTLEAIRGNQIQKGDVLSVARVAGIMGAKRTWELIPLCHQIPVAQVGVEFELDENRSAIHVTAEARTVARTGVEMEALTAVCCALLTIYDMAKSMDRGMTITGVALVEKSGGRSGDWSAREPGSR